MNNLLNLVSRVLKIKKNRININSNIKNIKEWDSVNHINIIIEIEREYKKKINPDIASELVSVKKIKQFLKI